MISAAASEIEAWPQPHTAGPSAELPRDKRADFSNVPLDRLGQGVAQIGWEPELLATLESDTP